MGGSKEELRGWVAGRIPEGWFTGSPEVTVDRDEILVVGTLSEPDVADGASDAEKEAARSGRIDGFREETRQQRMRIADDTEERFGRKVAWGAECGGVRKLFTTMSIPVMTRLRMPERQVLDTLVDAGVARSRSHALAWCVRLVGKNQEEWIKDLRDALVKVREVRAEGPA
jgi:hypothetical protein